MIAIIVEHCATCPFVMDGIDLGGWPRGGYAMQAILRAARRARWYAERKAGWLARSRKPTRAR
jgi:hypothetical protein